MTLVIAIQVLAAGLAAALFAERWINRDESGRPVASTDAAPDAIDFHPELIVRWDDESYAPLTSACSRPGVSDRRVRARTRSTAPRPRSFIR